jgi:2-polyprenyl-6-methoxyphenol hydroxylase-like FAD-dependent oxidoreductase
MLIMIDRGDYYQCGFIIRKGSFEAIKQQGLEAFRESILSLAPFLGDTVGELDSWDKVALLTVQVNRLRQWYRPGLLCLGDAAHAMSPAGGVGINLAIQDAVAAANLLAEKLRQKRVGLDDLRRVQQRREWPVRLTQAMQVFLHRRMFSEKFGQGQPFSFSWPVRQFLGLWAAPARRLAAQVIGIGFRAEHIKTPQIQ